jgi:hypothetical protein
MRQVITRELDGYGRLEIAKELGISTNFLAHLEDLVRAELGSADTLEHLLGGG